MICTNPQACMDLLLTIWKQWGSQDFSTGRGGGRKRRFFENLCVKMAYIDQSHILPPLFSLLDQQGGGHGPLVPQRLRQCLEGYECR